MICQWLLTYYSWKFCECDQALFLIQVGTEDEAKIFWN